MPISLKVARDGLRNETCRSYFGTRKMVDMITKNRKNLAEQDMMGTKLLFMQTVQSCLSHLL